jgi:hypothetical protein
MLAAPEASSINQVLHSDILGIIFEEHSKLDWRAPAIDGQVCCFWRQTVIGHPRAWSYVEIGDNSHPTASDLRLWLSRSGAAPLYIDIQKDDRDTVMLVDLLRDHTIRIKSFRLFLAPFSFFDSQAFPQLEDLNVARWSAQSSASSGTFGLMPNLRSLRIGCIDLSSGSWNAFPPLQVLSVYNSNCKSLINNSHNTITALMLDDLHFEDRTSSVVEFPSLTYLSLFDVVHFKHRVIAHSLKTYHEGGSTVDDSFPVTMPSVVEYGVYDYPTTFPDPTELHSVFPFLLRLSVRADPSRLPPILESIANEPDCLPALHIIAMGSFSRHSQISHAGLVEMERLISARRTRSSTDVTLHIEKAGSFHVPLFFGEVCCCSS